MALGLLPPIYWVEFFRSDLVYFLKTPYYLKPSSVLQAAMSPSSFIWWRKEMEWAVIPASLLIFGSLFVKEFQFLRWACQAVSVLATRPSCGDRQGMNYLLLHLYVWPLVGAYWGEVWIWPPFIFLQQPCNKEHKGIRRRF